MGFGPQLVDLNGDGQIDILSGSWPGELFFFQGGPDHTFAAPVKLKDKNGKTINIGGGVRRESGNYVLVAGDAKFETKGGKTVIVYEGETIEIPEGKQGGITGTASVAHAADWDGDGDYDLLVGDIGGSVYLVPNEGNAKEYAFGKEQPLQAGGKAIKARHGDAGPFAADWDGDGDLDLLVGCGDGSAVLYRNVGTKTEPELAAGETLVPAANVVYGADAPAEPQRGIRAKLCAADFNGDGRLDLLLGDFTTQKPAPQKLTAEQKAEHEKLRQELAELQEQMNPLRKKLHGPDRVKEKEERDKFQKEYNEVLSRYFEIRSRLPREYENHGWVWLFLRKPAETAASGR